MAAAGGLLFYLSDGLITWRRFVRHHRALDHAVIITYYAAQFCLAMSASAGYSAM
ncbi:MAG: lysoplasmalogenase family protein [Bacillota bacterium]